MFFYDGHTPIKQLVTLKGKSSGHPSKIILNNRTIKDPKAIATAFNIIIILLGLEASLQMIYL